MRVRSVVVVALVMGTSVTLAGCAEEKVDPLAVTNSATVSDITDNTGTDYYTVDSANLTTTAIGTRLELGFTILNSNGTYFSPVSTITFADGTVLTCEAGDPRRVPSLVASTDTWDFECDAAGFPADSQGASLVVVDEYN
jgi:hypothetical protein